MQNQNQNQNTIVVFGADWCGSCRTLKGLLESSEPDFDVQIIDVDTDHTTAQEYSVRGLPTVLLFAEGAEQQRATGLEAVKLVNALLGEQSS